MAVLSLFGFGLLLLPMAYLIVIAVASVRGPKKLDLSAPQTAHFGIVIPAHNEEAVIGQTVATLLKSDYPRDLFEIYVIADHCTDATAQRAMQAGAKVHVRAGESRSGKGEALLSCFEQILKDKRIDAVIVFDADTLVDSQFLKVMDSRVSTGSSSIQGQHIIGNPEDGWLPALIWAMFAIDNRYQNLGRTNLGLSAKNMGDSICLSAHLLRQFGWGRGLAEDYELRQRLLMHGLKIEYEPAARAYGEAPKDLRVASAQRRRWLAGAASAGKSFRIRLLKQGWGQKDPALIEGALQAWLPSYSTLSLTATSILLMQAVARYAIGVQIPLGLMVMWLTMVCVLVAYPFAGLALERARLKAYLAILMGPFFILWRTWLAIRNRFAGNPQDWVRTHHGGPIAQS